MLYLALATVLVILSTAPEDILVPLACLLAPWLFEALLATEFRIAFALAMPRLVLSLGFGTTTVEVCEEGAPLDLTVAP